MHSEIVHAEFNGKYDLSGKAFGKWIVIRYAGYREGSKRNHYWLCKCQCGTKKYVAYASLTCGKSTSCGCGFGRQKHRMTRTKIHGIWASIISRCENPNDHAYANYGARGIKICERWRNSLKAFVEDMGQPPSPSSSIDRIDNDKGYSPDNCRWATAKEQGRNKRNNRLLEVDGVELPLSEWAEKTGINQLTISSRIKRGWSVRDAVQRPIDENKRNIKARQLAGR